jgi:5'-nucleotidase
MKQLPRHAAATVAAALLALGLVACGNSDPVDSTPVTVKLIAMNDFHGNIEPPAENNGGAVVLKDSASATGTTKVRTGGAAYLASLIKQLKAKNPNSLVVGAGDMVGAAPVTSTLTHDEAAIDILGQIGMDVTSVGNHEFDHGKAELLRQQNGGCYIGGVVGQDTCISGGVFNGAKYKWLSANVVDTASGKPLFPATLTRTFGTVKVGFIGLTLKETPTVVTSTGVAGLSFLDEATTINSEAAKLKAAGVQAVVVLIHQGGQTTAATLNDQTCPGLVGGIVPIVDALSKDVDVVVSGHTHQEYVCTRNGKLLTSTGFYGSAVTEIDLTITPTGGVISKSANTVPVVNGLALTAGPATPVLPAGITALAKDATVDATVQSYVTLTTALKTQVVGSITADIKRALLAGGGTPTRDEGAEGAMGDLMADVYLAGGPVADIAFINPGGVRADLIFNASAMISLTGP